jgi:hypothetical protein
MGKARVKRCGKSAPRPWQQGRQGKPHREQDRIGAAGRARKCRGRGHSRPAARVGRVRRAVTRVAEEWLPLAATQGQNPAYRPSGAFINKVIHREQNDNEPHPLHEQKTPNNDLIQVTEKSMFSQEKTITAHIIKLAAHASPMISPDFPRVNTYPHVANGHPALGGEEFTPHGRVHGHARTPGGFERPDFDTGLVPCRAAQWRRWRHRHDRGASLAFAWRVGRWRSSRRCAPSSTAPIR